MEIIKKTKDKIGFKAEIPISLANAIRRSVNYIPILAVDSLEITKNDSALYDEVISHRVGLVPLQNEKLKLAKECDCGKEEGCSKCSMKLKMSAEGPGIVYSDQLSPKGSVVLKMPLTVLEEGQELEFVAIARVGLGIEHAKYSPGLIYYGYSEDLGKEDDESFKKLIEEGKKKPGKEIEVFVESWGQITPKEIFVGAIEALNKEIKELLKEIK
jgi:DNA-directed RNA polymerase subunit D